MSVTFYDDGVSAVMELRDLRTLHNRVFTSPPQPGEDVLAYWQQDRKYFKALVRQILCQFCFAFLFFSFLFFSFLFLNHLSFSFLLLADQDGEISQENKIAWSRDMTKRRKQSGKKGSPSAESRAEGEAMIEQALSLVPSQSKLNSSSSRHAHRRIEEDLEERELEEDEEEERHYHHRYRRRHHHQSQEEDTLSSRNSRSRSRSSSPQEGFPEPHKRSQVAINSVN